MTRREDCTLSSLQDDTIPMIHSSFIHNSDAYFVCAIEFHVPKSPYYEIHEVEMTVYSCLIPLPSPGTGCFNPFRRFLLQHILLSHCLMLKD